MIEREWLQFGHKFGDRCGHGISVCSQEEQSPIFLQWLDCVRQVHRQFPSLFEFNELFLVSIFIILFSHSAQIILWCVLLQIKLAMHTYSGLFGTFLFNSERERQSTHCSVQTCSVWAFLDPKENWSIRNYLHEAKSEVIKPAWQVRNLELWDSLYQSALLPCTVSCPTTPPAARPSTAAATELAPNTTDGPGELHDPVSPLEVSTPGAVASSSGPPTGGIGVPAVAADLPRSQSLSSLTVSRTTMIPSQQPPPSAQALACDTMPLQGHPGAGALSGRCSSLSLPCEEAPRVRRMSISLNDLTCANFCEVHMRPNPEEPATTLEVPAVKASAEQRVSKSEFEYCGDRTLDTQGRSSSHPHIAMDHWRMSVRKVVKS